MNNEKINEETNPASKTCLNCGASVEGNYCSTCGQSIKETLKISFGRFFKESILDFFLLDARLWKTLRAFFFKPGFLTQEYNAGRRIGYIPPFRFYLFTTLALLVASSLVFEYKKNTSDATPKSATFDTTNFSINFGAPKKPVVAVQVDSGSLDKLKNSNLKPDSAKKWFERRIKAGAMKVKDNPDWFVEVFFKRLSQLLFFLMPIFAVLLLLLYRRSTASYTEHLIFALHTHTFLFIALMCVVICQGVSDWLNAKIIGEYAQLLLFAAPAYLFAAMKRVYGQSIGKTLAKFLLLNSVYGVLLFVGFGAAAILALLGV